MFGVEIAEVIFERCTRTTSDSGVPVNSNEYEVTFNTEFLEDFQHPSKTALAKVCMYYVTLKSHSCA